MLEELLSTFISFEANAQRFDVAVLVGGGVVLLLAGLAVWLAGISFSRVVSAVLAAAVAFWVAFAATGGRISASIFACATGIIIGAIFRRPIFAVIVAIMVAACSFAILGQKADISPRVTRPSSISEGRRFSAGESWRYTCSFGEDFVQNAAAVAAKQKRDVFLYTGIAAVVALAVVFLLKDFGSAVACSAMGTLISLLGLTLLLFYRGTGPVTFASENPLLVSSVALGMLAFGTGIQLLLLRPRKAKKLVVQAPPKRLDEVEAPPPQVGTISLKPRES
jgi:hypothetical protein